MYILFEEKAEYGPWFRLIFGIPVVLFIAAIVAAFEVPDAFRMLLGEALAIALLFYFIVPRKYQVYQDKLKIILGTPIAFNIPFSTIKDARCTSRSKAFVYSGVRFATSLRYVIEIERKGAWNMVISPRNGEHFLGQLKQAIKHSKHRSK